MFFSSCFVVSVFLGGREVEGALTKSPFRDEFLLGFLSIKIRWATQCQAEISTGSSIKPNRKPIVIREKQTKNQP